MTDHNLLLEDYRSLTEAFWKSEQVGDTRVNLFIGLVTAVVAGLVTLTTAEHGPTGENLKLIFAAAFFALSLLGFVTLLRVLKRNRFTDRIKQSSNEIRQLFKDHFDPECRLLDYFPYGRRRETSDDAENAAIEKTPSKPIRKLGGLAHLTASVNSLLVAGTFGAAACPVPFQNASPFELTVLYIAIGASFVISLLAQFLFIHQFESETHDELTSHAPTHAGGLVYRVTDDRAPEYLLVGPKNKTEENSAKWVLPKGHIKNREGHGEAAIREVQEETGAVARWICLVDRVQFDHKGEKVDVKYYLMECMYQEEPHEKRRVQWFTYEEAIESLTHDQNKSLLKRAEQLRCCRLATVPAPSDK